MRALFGRLPDIVDDQDGGSLCERLGCEAYIDSKLTYRSAQAVPHRAVNRFLVIQHGRRCDKGHSRYLSTITQGVLQRRAMFGLPQAAFDGL